VPPLLPRFHAFFPLPTPNTVSSWLLPWHAASENSAPPPSRWPRCEPCRKRTHAHKSREKTAAQFRFHQGQNSRVYVKFLSLSAQLSLLSGGAWIQVKLPFPPSLIRPLFVPFPNMQRAASIKRSGLGHFSTSFLRFNLGHACESFFR
jgi:hypothetical protein